MHGILFDNGRKSANGIAVTSIGCGTGTICFLCFYKRKADPLQLTTILLTITAFGFLLFLLPYKPIKYMGLLLQGIGTFLSTLSWLFVGLCFEKWRSRIFVSITILLALFAVFVNAGLMELLRDCTGELYAIYAVLAVALLLLYFLIKPFYERAYHAASLTDNMIQEVEAIAVTSERDVQSAVKSETPSADPVGKISLSQLTKLEWEVADLISFGDSNGDIASMLFISEGTVKGHTKSIYRKLEIHSRFELATLVNRSRNENKQ